MNNQRQKKAPALLERRNRSAKRRHSRTTNDREEIMWGGRSRNAGGGADFGFIQTVKELFTKEVKWSKDLEEGKAFRRLPEGHTLYNGHPSSKPGNLRRNATIHWTTELTQFLMVFPCLCECACVHAPNYHQQRPITPHHSFLSAPTPPPPAVLVTTIPSIYSLVISRMLYK